MRMKVLFASLLLAASGQVLAQSSGQIGGQVFDENGVSRSGCPFLVKSSKTGTVTDIDGKFSLPSVKQGEAIVISYLGMDSCIVKAAPGMKVNTHSQDRQLAMKSLSWLMVSRRNPLHGFSRSIGCRQNSRAPRK